MVGKAINGQSNIVDMSLKRALHLWKPILHQTTCPQVESYSEHCRKRIMCEPFYFRRYFMHHKHFQLYKWTSCLHTNFVGLWRTLWMPRWQRRKPGHVLWVVKSLVERLQNLVYDPKSFSSFGQNRKFGLEFSSKTEYSAILAEIGRFSWKMLIRQFQCLAKIAKYLAEWAFFGIKMPVSAKNRIFGVQQFLAGSVRPKQGPNEI